jgi:hypothetical protein
MCGLFIRGLLESELQAADQAERALAGAGTWLGTHWHSKRQHPFLLGPGRSWHLPRLPCQLGQPLRVHGIGPTGDGCGVSRRCSTERRFPGNIH